MVTSVSSNTFLTTYHDDFLDSDNYHRILFNGGRVVQPRELTQLQTIIQRELTRLGNYLFKEGAILNASTGSLAAASTGIDYIVLNAEPAFFKDLENREVTLNGGNVKARIRKALTSGEATTLTSTAVTPGPTLLIEYLDGSGSTSSSTFAVGNVLNVSAGWAGSGQLTIRNTTGSVGRGSMIEMPELNLFALGRFVFVQGQKLVLDPYSPTPTRIVGYKVAEDIVSVTDDVTLYDNSGLTPNLSSPGADRYRIRLTLNQETSFAANNTDTFIRILKVENGILTAIITDDNQLNRLGEVLAARTRDINGDFIAKSIAGTFACEIGDDSDANFYQVNISPGVAFVGGYRVEKNAYTTLRVAKPRDTVEDILTITNETVPFTLGNYFLVDSMGGLVSAIGASAPYINLLTASNSKIGQAAIIQAEKVFDDSSSTFDYKVYVNDFTMDSTGTLAGILYDITDVRKLAASGSTTPLANIKTVQGAYGLQDRTVSDLFVPVQSQRVKSLTGVSADIAKVATGLTATVSGTVSFTDADGENVTNPGDWIIVNTTDRLTDESYSVTGVGTTVPTVSGLISGKVYNVVYFARRTYNLRSHSITSSYVSGASVTNGRIQTTIPYALSIISVIDTVTGEDVKYKFILDNGLRDSRIQNAILILKSGYTQSNSVNIGLRHFTVSATNKQIGVAQSYNTAYEYIPPYTNSFGVVYNSSDIIDFRPYKTTTYGGYPGLPKNNSLVEINTAVYWQPRVDRVFLSPDGQFRVAIGSTDAIAQYPEIPSDALLLCNVLINPYMKSKKDHELIRVDNSGYKMTQIRDLERRIANLEEITTLTLTELSVKDLSVKDANGLDRYKLGLTVDKFELNSQSNVTGFEQRALIDKANGTVGPVSVIRDMPLVYDSDLSYKTRRYGPLIWPEFSEVSYITQTQVSDTILVNQFSLRKYIGSGSISPATDTWTRSAKVTNTEGDALVTQIASQGNQLEGIDPYWKRLGYSSYQAFIADRT